jgi:ribosomal protein L7Ae-like RNA K-turn-binding protein
LDKVESLLSARGIPVVVYFSAAELGAVAGRESVAVIGVSDAGLTKGIRAATADSGGEADVAATTTRLSGRRDSRR